MTYALTTYPARTRLIVLTVALVLLAVVSALLALYPLVIVSVVLLGLIAGAVARPGPRRSPALFQPMPAEHVRVVSSDEEPQAGIAVPLAHGADDIHLVLTSKGYVLVNDDHMVIHRM